MTKEKKSNKPITDALMRKRKKIILHLNDEGYIPAHIAYVMNISRQLVNYIIKHQNK